MLPRRVWYEGCGMEVISENIPFFIFCTFCKRVSRNLMKVSTHIDINSVCPDVWRMALEFKRKIKQPLVRTILFPVNKFINPNANHSMCAHTCIELYNRGAAFDTAIVYKKVKKKNLYLRKSVRAYLLVQW